jgi:hypothetical protein
MTGGRARVSAVALTALAVGMMLVLIMLAARTGPQRIIHGTLVDPGHGHLDFSYQSPRLASIGRHHGQGIMPHLVVLSWAGRILRIGLLALAAWLVYRGLLLLRELVRDRARPEPRPTEVQFEVLDDPDVLVDEIRSDAAAQLALLHGGSPRNAIVACWDRFEQQAGRVGLTRKPWETSSEFTLRALDFVAADGGAVARLERLYHEARFSEHPIDEDRRTAAVEALETIHASLPTRTRAGR